VGFEGEIESRKGLLHIVLVVLHFLPEEFLLHRRKARFVFFNPRAQRIHLLCLGKIYFAGREPFVGGRVIEVITKGHADVVLSLYDGRAEVFIAGDNEEVTL